MKTLKIIFFISIILYLISLASADAQYISTLGIIVNGSGNTLSSIDDNVSSTEFSYLPATGTAVANANIFIDENSELILNNQTLIFNCSYAGECRLETNSNGTHERGGNSTLTIVNRSCLTAGNTCHEFYMVVRNNSAFTMRDSKLTDCGFNSTHPGLNISAKYANITDNVIHDVYYGIHLNYADYCSISGNNISANWTGIYLYYADNCSISGNNISSQFYQGIYLKNSDYCSISGNNISSDDEGILMQYSNYCDISMDRISSVQSGIYLSSSNNNNISNSMVFSSDFRGFYLVSSDYCSISGNNISSEDEGIYLSSSDNNNISNSHVSSSNSHGVYLINSDDVIFTSSHLEGTERDLKLNPAENISLINTTCSDIEITVITSYLHRFWYLDVYVKDSNVNPVQGVNVSCWMWNGTRAFTTPTASTGYIERQTVEQYYQNSTNFTYHTPHKVNVSKGNYLPHSKTFYLNESKLLTFELNAPPNVTLISVDGESSGNFITNNKTPEIKYKFTDPEQSNATCGVVIDSLDTSTIHTPPSLLVQNDTVINITSPELFEGNWTVYVECNDSTDFGVSENWIFYVNKLPEVQLIHPGNNTLHLGGVVDFMYNVSDNESSLNCTFYNDFTGTWRDNGSQNITPSTMGFFTANLTDGVYTWNMKCFDGYQKAFAPHNYTIKVDSNTPDLSIAEADVIFSPSAPEEGDTLWITVTVWNNGIDNVTNATVEFKLDGNSRVNKTLSVPGESSNSTKFSWTASEGSHNFTFIVDPEDYIEEFYEGNNRVTIWKTVAPTTTPPPPSGGGSSGGNPPYVGKPLPSCFDGIQNQGEEGIDCGGPCNPCMSCLDGIQNQGEEGIDCGGPCPPCDETTTPTTTPTTIPSTPTTTLAGGAKSAVETESGTATDLRGSDMVNIAVPLRNITSTSKTSTSTSTTTPESDKTGLLEVSQRYVGAAQKQIFEFMSGVYDIAADNPAESTVSALLLLGMFYVYYSRVRSSGLGKETDQVKDKVDGKKK